MKEYIEREAAIAVIYNQHVGGKEACENARPNTYGADLREIVADIEDMPAADVVTHEEYKKLQEENTKLKNKVWSLKKKLREMKSDASWDEDIRRGQVQGMW